MSQRPPHAIQNVIDRNHAEFFRLKRSTTPSSVMIKFLMARFEDHVQKLLVAARTSDVFRWAFAFSGNADRLCSALGWHELLQNNLVPPVVAEVIDVDQRIAVGL